MPQGTDVLLMVHPPALDEWQTYVIDQFLVHEGAALIAIDPVSRGALAQQAELRAKYLDPLLAGPILSIPLVRITSSTAAGGNWPMVPITSGWPAWPIRMTVRPDWA